MTLLRILKIWRVLAKHRLDRAFSDQIPGQMSGLRLLRWLFVLCSISRRTFKSMLSRTGSETPAVSVRLALEELGPVFIKFGQILSTRRDLFSEALSDELQKLQDQVPPFDTEEAIAVIEASLGNQRQLADVFASFDATPLASASVAQIHTARLATTGDEVVVKVIRPGIERAIRTDVAVMYFCARWLERLSQDARRLHPIAVVKDYEATILGELNLQLEAANTIRLRANWRDSGKLYVPRIYTEYSSRDVMVMERIYGVTATNLKALNAHHTDMKKLAHLGVEIFFSQVFEDNFFHADMHPGNVFVDITDPDSPTYIALDCAIIGSLTETDKSYLARNLLAFFHQDYDQVAQLHIKSGWVPADTNEQEFAAVIRSVCEPIFQKPIKEISFGKVLLSLFQAARQFNMEVQPQLVLLQKTLINIEGMGRQIYPDLDLWETAAPFMEHWMKQRVGLQGLIRKISESAPRWLEQLPEIPDLAYNTMLELRQLSAQSHSQAETLHQIKQALSIQARRRKYQRLGGLTMVAAIFAILIPMSGSADPVSSLLPGGLLGTLGIYWMYIHS